MVLSAMGGEFEVRRRSSSRMNDADLRHISFFCYFFHKKKIETSLSREKMFYSVLGPIIHIRPINKPNDYFRSIRYK